MKILKNKLKDKFLKGIEYINKNPSESEKYMPILYKMAEELERIDDNEF